MSGEVANLGLSVDSSQVKAGTQDLKAFSGAANDAGKAADSLGAKTKASVGAFGDMSKAIAATNSTAKDGASTVAQMGASINAALAKNVVTFDAMRKGIADVNSVTGAATAATRKLADAHGGFSTQGQAAFHALRSFGEQLALGVPITQAATAQMGHLSYAASGDGGVTGAFSQVVGKVDGAAASLLRFVTPVSATVGAVAAFAAGGIAAATAWESSQSKIARSLTGLGALSGATVADINAVGLQMSRSADLSAGAATDIAASFAATGKIAPQSLAPAVQASTQLAKALGIDVSDAAKMMAQALADPAKGAEDLRAKIGGFSVATEDMIEKAQQSRDSLQAQAILLRETIRATEDAAKANEGYGASFTKLWNEVKSGAYLLGGDLVKGFQSVRQASGGPIATAGLTKQQQLSSAQDQLSNLQSIPEENYDRLAGGAEAAKQKIQELKDTVARLNQEIANGSAAKLAGDMDEVARNAKAAASSLDPSIDKIKQLEQQINDLTRARDLKISAGLPTGEIEAMLGKAQNLRLVLQQTSAEQQRYQQYVAQTAGAYPELTQQTALQLDKLQSQLPVIQAIGGEAQRQAQYVATVNDLMAQGKSLADATALAAQQETNARAEAVAQAQAKTQALNDSIAIMNAGLGLQGEEKSLIEGAVAARQAYNNVLRDTGSQQEALNQAIAVQAQYEAQAAQVSQQESVQKLKQAQQEADREDQIWKMNQRAVQASQDQVDLAKAAGTNMEASVKAAIAYRNAIDQGATATQAAAISANTLEANLIQAAKAAASLEQAAVQDLNSKISGAVYDSAGNLVGINNGTGGGSPSTGGRPSYFNTDGKQYTSVGGDPRLDQFLRTQAKQENLGISGLVDTAYSGGDLVAALKAVKNAPNTYGADPVMAASLARKGYDLNAILGPQRSTIDDKISQMDTLVQLQNAKTNNKDEQVANLKAEMDWLQALPETISRDQKIVSLQQSIDQLKNATDANTAATAATLNPLYSQGHGALPQIGYFHAASGLDVIAQGPTVGDQVPFKAMVNGGERIRIETPAQQAENDKGSRSPPIIEQHFDFRGTQSNSRRTARQFAQGFGQSAAAMSR
ncbi:phage tail length tape measure family protein [Bradyrhizobium elkanii]|uniref:phage tail length tape measure family protein n=1 Tax=Bradyrhizobium elkanii TaxID=29448 RepID=UPI002226E409|nr:phage tail length tape measure family protein [Bradyrhizobium elkanii]MCW2110273.1 archaellum component FlaC [Bradyrhizobium elkanii]WLB76441.1 phage tail length tape measure family protein [Bradyrhizobium elkanii]